MSNSVCIGRVEVAKIFLENGIDVNIKDELKKTALHHAATIGNEQLVDLFLSHGANVNAIDFADRKPLFFAAAEGHLKIVQILLEKGATLEPAERDIVVKELNEKNDSIQEESEKSEQDLNKVKGIFELNFIQSLHS